MHIQLHMQLQRRVSPCRQASRTALCSCTWGGLLTHSLTHLLTYLLAYLLTYLQVGDLSRRFAATLLRRVACRLEENANVLEGVELTRSVAQRAAAADRAVADLIEPASPDREATPA